MLKGRKSAIDSSQIYLFLMVYVCTWIALTADTSEHQNSILSDVRDILRVDTPGSISLLSEIPFPILAGVNGGVLRPHVAAAEYGTGRIVAYSHNSFYLKENIPAEYGNVKLFVNSANWVRKNSGQKVGMQKYDVCENILLEHGFEAKVLTPNNFNNLTHLEQFDILLLNSGIDFDREIIRTYVRNGGGLLIGATPWAVFSDVMNDMDSFWANVVLRDTGLFFIPKYYMDATMEGNCFNVSLECLKDTNSVTVWEYFKQYNSNQTQLSRGKLKQIMTIIKDRFEWGSSNNSFNIEVSEELREIPTFVPTKTNPVIDEFGKYYLLVHRHLCDLLNIVGYTSDIPAHPSATSFPGYLTISKDQRLTHLIKINHEVDASILPRTTQIDATQISWHSTGLYARPGEEIIVQVLDADQSMSQFNVQIGAHTDNLEGLESWPRCPSIVFQNKILNNRSTIANPFGGPIYFTTSESRNISLLISIEGGIPSPTFFMGKTSPSEWINEIKNYAAPWGELVGRKLIIMAQKSFISQINDPEEVIDLWNRIMDAMSDLINMPRDRVKAERFVPDVQIGGGYMHSGNPIMYFLESQVTPINSTMMRQEPSKLWGFLHELGHNHVKDDWTFSGTGEVTCNLFALYVLHEIFDCPTNESEPGLKDSEVAGRLKNYIDNGKDFLEWKSIPFLALHTYIQLQEAYGWPAYQKVFVNYQDLNAEEHPKNDQEKMDLWMVMFSKVVKENLAPFFISWGMPISHEAVEIVKNLPETTLRIPS